MYLTVLCALGGVQAFALPLCALAQLTTYTTAGFTCTLGQFTAKSFVFSQTGPGVPPNQITLVPVVLPDKVGFKFVTDPNFDVTTTDLVTYKLNFFLDPPPDIIRGGEIDLDPSGEVSLQTSYCTTDFPCAGPSQLGTITATPAVTTQVLNFPLFLHALGVSNNFILDARNGTPARSNGWESYALL
ncbi:MAG: hypothetical protein HY235_01060, partial [Acidobacteria bacterium]|nr:hypothetical protein [Acidobacteriota bacterium]